MEELTRLIIPLLVLGAGIYQWYAQQQEKAQKKKAPPPPSSASDQDDEWEELQKILGLELEKPESPPPVTTQPAPQPQRKAPPQLPKATLPSQQVEPLPQVYRTEPPTISTPPILQEAEKMRKRKAHVEDHLTKEEQKALKKLSTSSKSKSTTPRQSTSARKKEIRNMLQSQNSLRQAVVLMEVLGKPVSLK